MAAVHGKDGHFTYNSVNLSPFGTEFTLTIEGDTAETTTFGDAAKEYVRGQYGWTISASGIWDGASGAVDATLGPDVLVTTARAVIVRQNSAAKSANNPEWTGSVFLTSYETNPTIGDAVQWSAEFQGTGALTRDAS